MKGLSWGKKRGMTELQVFKAFSGSTMTLVAWKLPMLGTEGFWVMEPKCQGADKTSRRCLDRYYVKSLTQTEICNLLIVS